MVSDVNLHPYSAAQGLRETLAWCTPRLTPGWTPRMSDRDTGQYTMVKAVQVVDRSG